MSRIKLIDARHRASCTTKPRMIFTNFSFRKIRQSVGWHAAFFCSSQLQFLVFLESKSLLELNSRTPQSDRDIADWSDKKGNLSAPPQQLSWGQGILSFLNRVNCWVVNKHHVVFVYIWQRVTPERVCLKECYFTAGDWDIKVKFVEGDIRMRLHSACSFFVQPNSDSFYGHFLPELKYQACS